MPTLEFWDVILDPFTRVGKPGLCERIYRKLRSPGVQEERALVRGELRRRLVGR